MGGCFSKKSRSSSSSSSPAEISKPVEEKKPSNAQMERKKAEEETVKKEIFIIKHRKSHEIDKERNEQPNKVGEVVEPCKNPAFGNVSNGGLGNCNGVLVARTPVRTSSCTKEEVDAILIQCGRLSRSSSTGKAGSSENTKRRKYSGSKRSYDFDNENGSEERNNSDNVADDNEDGGTARGREHSHRRRRSPSQGRRRTPSRDRDQQQQQRSGSRERAGANGGSGRRVSRSPGRRSDSPITSSNGGNLSSAGNNNKPGKMVSVPATVSSLTVDKNHNPDSSVKRIQVKRNVGTEPSGTGSRTAAASPRSRSPARVNQPATAASLSRSNSRKAEQSPYRRNPLAEIDTNIVMLQKPNTENNRRNVTQGTENNKTSSNKLENHTVANGNFKPKEQHSKAEDKAPGGFPNNATSGLENHNHTTKPQTVARSRSSRLSRDLDITPETLSLNPPASSYTALLLEDIQNFHQKKNNNNTTPPAAFSLPPCLTKACSLLEEIADLNSSNGSDLTTQHQFTKLDDEKKTSKKTTSLAGSKDPFVESEVVLGGAKDDLMEPSFHKYVTVRRRGSLDLDEQESSGSNSFVASQQHWVSSSSWEPSSVDSTDRSNYSWGTQKTDHSPIGGFQVDNTRRRVNAKMMKDESIGVQQSGIGRGRVGFAATA